MPAADTLTGALALFDDAPQSVERASRAPPSRFAQQPRDKLAAHGVAYGTGLLVRDGCGRGVQHWRPNEHDGDWLEQRATYAGPEGLEPRLAELVVQVLREGQPTQ